MILNNVHSGLDEAPVLLLIHGLFGSASNLSMIGKAFIEDHRIVIVDARNHGRSDWADSMLYRDMALDVLETMDSLDIEKASVFGHSMGGKIAMAAALVAPERFEKLIIADIAPVAYRHDLLHYAEAMLSVDLSSIKSRSDADRQLQATISELPVRQFLLQNLVRSDGGQLQWRLNLNVVRDQMTVLTGWDVDPPEHEVSTPLLSIYGGLSDYVGAHRQAAFNAYFSDVEFQSIADAGHWLHAEKPKDVIKAVKLFL